MSKPAPIYLDYAATTPVRPEVLETMLPYLRSEVYGNPSSAHRFGRSARAGVEEAKRRVAEAVGAEPNQVIFTSGGTEADNLAVVGGALAAKAAGRKMRAAAESTAHKAILAAAHAVVHLGGEEEILPVDGNGQLDLAAIDEALARKPGVLSIMWVNNETGAIQRVAEIGARCRAAGVTFHVDGVQAFGKVPLAFKDIPVDLLTISGHKIGAPKGVGALLVKDRHAIEAIIHGGGQQYGLRPGTENVPGIVALGRAAQLTAADWTTESRRIGELRDQLWQRLQAIVPDLVQHAAGGPRAHHVLSVGVSGADSEALLMHLDLAGIAVSAGSACTTGSVEPSHVLVAMGVPRELAIGTVRMSLGHETTPAEIDRVVEVFPGVVDKVRKLAGVLGRA
ncbi:MAG: cysteine desulfurase family protein [Gemmatimonadales bacterium]